jgi:BlaI family transcriptional regulator, penicillinase repressor
MRYPAEDVTKTELAILQVLWQSGRATRRQIVDALYPGGGESHYATVQKLLERLEAKGFVRHRREGNVLIFSAAVDRETMIGRRLRDVADKLCDGSVTPLLTHLVRAQRLTPDEVDELQALLDALRREQKSKGKSRQ